MSETAADIIDQSDFDNQALLDLLCKLLALGKLVLRALPTSGC